MGELTMRHVGCTMGCHMLSALQQSHGSCKVTRWYTLVPLWHS